MHILTLKWSKLNMIQRGQILTQYKEELKQKQVFQHTLNGYTYRVNPTNGRVIFN